MPFKRRMDKETKAAQGGGREVDEFVRSPLLHKRSKPHLHLRVSGITGIHRMVCPIRKLSTISTGKHLALSGKWQVQNTCYNAFPCCGFHKSEGGACCLPEVMSRRRLLFVLYLIFPSAAGWWNSQRLTWKVLKDTPRNSVQLTQHLLIPAVLPNQSQNIFLIGQGHTVAFKDLKCRLH